MRYFFVLLYVALNNNTTDDFRKSFQLRGVGARKKTTPEQGPGQGGFPGQQAALPSRPPAGRHRRVPCSASAPLLVRATQPGWAAQQHTDEALPEACGTPSGGRLSARPGPQPPPHLRQRARGVAMATRMRTAPTPLPSPAAAPSPPAALPPPPSLSPGGRGGAWPRRGTASALLGRRSPAARGQAAAEERRAPT